MWLIYPKNLNFCRKEILAGIVIHIFQTAPSITFTDVSRDAFLGATELCAIEERIFLLILAPSLKAVHKFILNSEREGRFLVIYLQVWIQLPFKAIGGHHLTHNAESAARLGHFHYKIEHQFGIAVAQRGIVVIFHSFHKHRVKSFHIFVLHRPSVDANHQFLTVLQLNSARYGIYTHIGQMHLAHQVAAIGCLSLYLTRRHYKFAVIFIYHRSPGHCEFAKGYKSVEHLVETICRKAVGRNIFLCLHSKHRT